MFSFASNVATSAWLDLLRLLQDGLAAEFSGKPYLKRINNRAYWYVQQRIGTSVHDRYIAEDSPELRERLEIVANIRARAKETERTRAQLVRVLRDFGYRAPDVQTGSLLSAMAKVGVFRLGGTLVGTGAFQHYEGALGVFLQSGAAAMTNDIDIAQFERLSLVLQDNVGSDLQEEFRRLEFEPLPTLDNSRVWRWKQSRHQTLVEFLTPSFSEDEGLRNLPALGVQAQSLHYLNYLIADPIKVPLLYRQGFLIQIPRPERYAIHKLIIADRRRQVGSESALKSQKDLAQAEMLIEVLRETRPYELQEALEDARGRGPKWNERLDRTLARAPQVQRMLDAL